MVFNPSSSESFKQTAYRDWNMMTPLCVNVFPTVRLTSMNYFTDIHMILSHENWYIQELTLSSEPHKF